MVDFHPWSKREKKKKKKKKKRKGRDVATTERLVLNTI
jgi:hypothetical protein